ncbi:L7Ae/L30e/S12e/Gadd45 family ribosomal protein [Acholeplasma equifetale]|jgi:ribosomal protein L7Ae-like RNA K-turn-binding protein|uniref:L7Ae/L30e/S12e/Gadd45 family ribosomal protein n=1 Tax=Acholeplasma equifetale TaxID=264634 RepID=UPI000552C4CD|nr:ribosomal L7Ae/L30e/S12e/Gadd45 family protein [Acholeplasma equifetale]
MKINNLGLAYAAKKIILGTDECIKAMQQGKLYLVLLAKDASQNTVKKISDKTKTYEVPLNMEFSTVELSHAIGKLNVKVIGILDRGFSLLLK